MLTISSCIYWSFIISLLWSVFSFLLPHFLILDFILKKSFFEFLIYYRCGSSEEWQGKHSFYLKADFHFFGYLLCCTESYKFEIVSFIVSQNYFQSRWCSSQKVLAYVFNFKIFTHFFFFQHVKHVCYSI